MFSVILLPWHSIVGDYCVFFGKCRPTPATNIRRLYIPKSKAQPIVLQTSNIFSFSTRCRAAATVILDRLLRWVKEGTRLYEEDEKFDVCRPNKSTLIHYHDAEKGKEKARWSIK